MRGSDLKREENYDEYLRLLQNDDYVDVTYDEASGGMSAIHKLHKFDKRPGPYGMKRGDYERVVLDVMRKLGTRIVLESEISSPGNRMCDGYLNDIPMEIKAIEGMGIWTIGTKLRIAENNMRNASFFISLIITCIPMSESLTVLRNIWPIPDPAKTYGFNCC